MNEISINEYEKLPVLDISDVHTGNLKVNDFFLTTPLKEAQTQLNIGYIVSVYEVVEIRNTNIVFLPRYLKLI